MRGVLYFFYCLDGDFYYRGCFRIGRVNAFVGFKLFGWYSWLIGFSFVMISILVVFHVIWPFSPSLERGVVIGGVFCFDVVSFYLVLLSSFLWISLWF